MKIRGLATLLALAGCGVPMVTASNVGSMPTLDVCTGAIVARNLGDQDAAAIADAEIKRRGEFSAAEISRIRQNSVAPGMSERAAICAWGTAYDAVNVTTTGSGVNKQFVYRSDYTKTRYFYTRNGQVTTVQE